MNATDKIDHPLGRCDCLSYSKGTDEYDSARKSIREENRTALTYSGIWLGIIFIMFSLIGQRLLQQCTPPLFPAVFWLTIVVEGVLLLAAILMMLACWVYWHGCSFEHTPTEYLVMNESGDALMTFASLLTLMGVYLSGSTVLMRAFSAESYSDRFLLLLAPLFITIGVVILVNYLFTPKIGGITIVHEYLIEASKMPYYGKHIRVVDSGDLSKKEIKELKDLVEGRRLRVWGALIILVVFVLVLTSACLSVR